jgi:chromosome segregation ATPase
MPRKSSPAAKAAKPAAKSKAAAKATAKAQAGDRPARQKEPSLADLKGQVLALAKVSSTKEIKRTNVDLRHLDFRLKASWRSALGVLQQAAVAMAEWERNPPEEYKELFAEIDQAAAAYNASIEQGLKLSSQLRDAADDLDALAGELQQQAEELKTIEQASRKQHRARSLN